MAELNRVNPRYMRNVNAMESIRAKIINRIDNLSPNQLDDLKHTLRIEEDDPKNEYNDPEYQD